MGSTSIYQLQQLKTMMANAELESEPAAKSGLSEDWLAILAGWIVLLVALATVTIESKPDKSGAMVVAGSSSLSNWIAKPGGWTASPTEAFYSKSGKPIVGQIAGSIVLCLLLFGIMSRLSGESIQQFFIAFGALAFLALLAYLLSGQKLIKASNLEYPLWALLIGLLISNTIGSPQWLRPALRTELYIKTGLVLLGAEVLLSRLLKLGIPGVFVSWVVTPIVLITTFWFGQRILKMKSASLNMVISADMSVCGVSAAIATAAACRAKKEELSLAIAISLAFTVVMMIVMPIAIRYMGIDEVVGGAWIGGTIDSSGAVSAAGEMLGPVALEVAATTKMIQNILIGVIAFAVAAYWVTFVEKSADSKRPEAMEIWRRFPKFIIGFVAASILFSLISSSVQDGAVMVDTVINVVTKDLRGWFFCLAFVSIGIETSFRELGKHMKGGTPIVLYVCGQTLNLVLTLAMAWLMFKVVFPEASEVLPK
jgi:uncharacterized integral membrane protein (TIGR00698 family)